MTATGTPAPAPGSAPAHRDSTTDAAPQEVTRASLVAVWAGRVLVPLTAALVVATRLTRPWWERQGLDETGYPAHWLPNVTFALLLAVGILAPWLCGLVASPWASRRDGAEMVVTSVTGRRRFTVASCRVVDFRILSTPSTSHGAVVVGPRGGVVVLLAGLPHGGRRRITALLGDQPRDGLGRAVREHLLGLALLLLTVAVVFGVLGLGSWAAGGVL
jgi:hypothetical protein